MVTVTPVAFILWVVVIVPGFHAVGADTAAELTAVQMATIRTRWIVAWPIYAVAVLLGAAWRASLNAAPARNHRSRVGHGVSACRRARRDQRCGQSGPGVVAGHFTEARLGLAAAYDGALVLSYLAIWSGAIAVRRTSRQPAIND
jgi:hypothetical protein